MMPVVPCMVAAALYLPTVFLGQEIMRLRPPMKVKPLLFLWNTFAGNATVWG